MNLKKKISSRIALIGVLLLPLNLPADDSLVSEEFPTAHVVVGAAVSEHTISPLLLGSQFNFFSPPIVSSITSPVLLNNWKDVPVTSLRYPGGTWCDHYMWDNPSASYFGGRKSKAVVTQQQFIDACRIIGAEPIFQVNVMSKGGRFDNRINPTKIEDIRAGAQWAARWVETANIDNGWNVKYWEIGNEVWIWLKPEEYARYVVEYSRAMKAVDPSIKIIACGLSRDVGPYNPHWMAFPDDPGWQERSGFYNYAEDWTDTLLAEAEGAFDYLAPHIYQDGKPFENISVEERYLATTAVVWDNQQLRGDLAFLHPDSGPRLAVTEWGTNFKESVPFKQGYQEGLYFYTLANGLNTALMFGQIVQASDITDIAIVHSLDDIETLWYWPEKILLKTPIKHPAMLALTVWGHNLGTRMLPISVKGEPALSISGKDYPSLFSYASADDEYFYVVCINLSPSDAVRISVDLPADLVGSVSCMELVGDALGCDNFSSWDQQSEPAIRIVRSAFTPEERGWSRLMPPHSMAGFTVKKRPYEE